MTTLCFDYDAYLYKAAAIGEERSIKVIHRGSGDEYEFANRTAFYGKSRARNGGWLAEWNAAKSEERRRDVDAFDIVDVQTPLSITACYNSVNEQILSIKEAVGAKKYYGYSGRGKTFREDVSTIMKYKGARDDTIRPLHLNDLREYMVMKHSCKIITEIEADDACSIDSYDGWKKWIKTHDDKDKVVLAYVDKDAKQLAGHLYNTNKNTWLNQGEIFGSLWLVKNNQNQNEVDGCGRMWLYFQVLSGDNADCYCANSGNPDVKWADMSAYKLLKDAKNDKEAWEALVKGYKTIYPSKRSIIGWRGWHDFKMTQPKDNAEDFRIEVDWFYALNENFQLAKMLRWKNDKVDVEKLLDKLQIDCDGLE